MTIEKYIKDGKVAVLVSAGDGGDGGGWSTRNPDYPSLLFDPTIVEMVLTFQKKRQGIYGEDYYNIYKPYYEAIQSYIDNNILIDYKPVYIGCISNLTVEWVPIGERFCIYKYNGYENLVLESEMEWYTA